MTRRQADPDVLAEIRTLLIDGYAPRRVFELVGQRHEDRAPSLRTIYSIAAELRPQSGPGWSLATADPGEAALVLPVLAAVVRRSDGRLGHFTEETAAWIARIRRVAPRLPLYESYRWAVRYQTAIAAGRDTRELDQRLALDTEKPPRQG